MVADVGHAQWVFTVPKLLRPYFMHHRALLGPLCAAAWQTIRELMAVAAGEEKGLRPGMVAMSQTFGDRHSPPARPRPRHPRRLDRLRLSWRHSGFSVHNSVTVPARDGHGDEMAKTFDALDFVARLLAHVPDPRRHLVHDYGAYSNVVRGKLEARSQARKAEPPASGPACRPAPPPASRPGLTVEPRLLVSTAIPQAEAPLTLLQNGPRRSPGAPGTLATGGRTAAVPPPGRRSSPLRPPASPSPKIELPFPYFSFPSFTAAATRGMNASGVRNSSREKRSLKLFRTSSVTICSTVRPAARFVRTIPIIPTSASR